MTYSFALPVAARFSSLFAADQVWRLAEYGSTPMIINVTTDGEIYYDVHPLALWIVCSALVFHGKRSHSISYYHERNSCAVSGSHLGTGTPLDEAFRRMRVCIRDAQQGWGNFADADPMQEALAALNGWVPSEAQIIALRRGNWSMGFDFDRFCPDLPAHDGWAGKASAML
jgi:hypothetical protein